MDDCIKTLGDVEDFITRLKGNDTIENDGVIETASAADLYLAQGISGLQGLLDAISKETPYEENGIKFTSARDLVEHILNSSLIVSGEGKEELLAFMETYNKTLNEISDETIQ